MVDLQLTALISAMNNTCKVSVHDVWHIIWIKFCKATYLALLKTVWYIWSVCTRLLLFLLLFSLCIIWLSYSCSTMVRVLLLIIHSGFRVRVPWWIMVIILDGWPQHPMGTFSCSQGVNMCRSPKKEKTMNMNLSLQTQSLPGAFSSWGGVVISD